ncbi:hypothetical protein GALL_547840 [mine drainage metagenome]|uniref:Uncharacterized protein n=1 Tax=mine drainage metagenome TaxID=410659 RepID=A0A1J5NY35_9ZZZZ
MSRTGVSKRVSNRRSRLVTMPTTLPFSITGKPEMPCCMASCTTSRTLTVGEMVMGSRSTPDSKRLTRATSAAWALALKFLWMMPIPPSCAMAMASRDSVTVSIAAETRGILREILRVRRVARLVSLGNTWEYAGTNSTSSKVSAFPTRRIDASRQKQIIKGRRDFQMCRRNSKNGPGLPTPPGER